MAINRGEDVFEINIVAVMSLLDWTVQYCIDAPGTRVVFWLHFGLGVVHWDMIGHIIGLFLLMVWSFIMLIIGI